MSNDKSIALDNPMRFFLIQVQDSGTIRSDSSIESLLHNFISQIFQAYVSNY
jgi:hypothetical protein